MGGTPVTEAEFKATVDEIGPKTQEMSDGINKCVAKYNNQDWGCWADTFGSDDRDKIGQTLAQLNEVWSDFCDEFAKLSSPGWPFWFLDSADAWLDVKSTLTGEKVFLTSGASISLPATESWNAPEARTYKAMPGVNADALDGAAAHADTLASHLHDHGMYIIDLWFQVGMKIIDYAQLIAQSVGRFLTADPTKWLDIVAEIVGMVNDLVNFVQEILELIMDKWADTKKAMFNVESAFAKVDGSVRGAWPTVENLG